MLSIVMRAICVMFWFLAAVLGYGAWVEGDWRLLIGQLAQALLAVVIWFAVPRGVSEFGAPSFGSRGLRIALYASTLVTAIVASSPWPFWFDDSRGSESAAILFFATALIVPFLQKERKLGATA